METIIANLFSFEKKTHLLFMTRYEAVIDDCLLKKKVQKRKQEGPLKTICICMHKRAT